jgi:GNAT superfamily N-acetyltransferase
MAESVLRAAQNEDVDAIVGVFQRSRRAAMPWLPILHSHTEDLAFFGNQIAVQQAWVIDAGGVVEAFAIASDGWLNHLYVEPERRRSGLGTGLVKEVKQHFAGGLQLWAFEANTAARAFYAREGFVEVERTDGSGNEERTPDVRMIWLGSVADLGTDGV